MPHGGSSISALHMPHTVEYMQMATWSFSSLFLGLLQDARSSLLKLQPNAQNHGIFPIGVILGLIMICTALYLPSPYRRLPPGPRGYPLIGNLLDIRSGQWLKFAEWRKKYGDLIYLNAAGQPIVILNSYKVAGELLDRRSMIYSDRPQNIVASDIMASGLMFALSHFDDTWRRMRKAANEGFNKTSVKRFYEKQTTEAILLASDCLVKPTQWDDHFRHAAASLTLSVVYGCPPIASEEDNTIMHINDFTNRLCLAVCQGTYWVEFFPWMRHIPSRLAKWKRDAEDWSKKDTAMLEGLFRTVEENVAKGDDDQSLCATLIHEAERNKLSSQERSWVAGTMYIGGAESTSTMMAWWTLAMIAYPETQSRAHAELDAVVGRERLPTFADYPHLPYVRAMVKEVLRWGPVTPLAAPHRLMEDDWYEGMFLPKGTICIPNVWHMNRDPEIYGENTEHFDPARHLETDGDVAPTPSDARQEGHFSYGFGRRLCVGRHMSNNTLFIDIAIMLWATNIERKKDASGEALPLNVDGFVDHGIVVRPAPFECEISPRFPEALALLAQERVLRGL